MALVLLLSLFLSILHALHSLIDNEVIVTCFPSSLYHIHLELQYCSIFYRLMGDG